MTTRKESGPPIPGTARYRREFLMGPVKVSQPEVGAQCRPKLAQGAISQFENAEYRMTRKRIRQIAPGYFPSEFVRAPEAAVRQTWKLWGANVEAYGSEAMKAYWETLKPFVLTDVPGLSATPLLDPNQNPALSADARDALENPDAPVLGRAEDEKRKLA
jgi:hypothetical protein